jgi:hypothetical protein
MKRCKLQPFLEDEIKVIAKPVSPQKIGKLNKKANTSDDEEEIITTTTTTTTTVVKKVKKN